MGVLEVKKYLDKWARGKDVLELEASCATVVMAAQAVGVTPARIAKTISFSSDEYSKEIPQESKVEATARHGCILIASSGDSKVDNAKFKRHFGFKARMLSAEETLAATGHAVGGVCPFAVEFDQVKIYLDVSLQRFTTVFAACGSSNSLIELTPNELLIYSNALGWADVCKGWQNSPEPAI